MIGNAASGCAGAAAAAFGRVYPLDIIIDLGALGENLAGSTAGRHIPAPEFGKGLPEAGNSLNGMLVGIRPPCKVAVIGNDAYRRVRRGPFRVKIIVGPLGENLLCLAAFRHGRFFGGVYAVRCFASNVIGKSYGEGLLDPLDCIAYLGALAHEVR
jgi:hypothetical protein